MQLIIIIAIRQQFFGVFEVSYFRLVFELLPQQFDELEAILVPMIGEGVVDLEEEVAFILLALQVCE